MSKSLLIAEGVLINALISYGRQTVYIHKYTMLQLHFIESIKRERRWIESKRGWGGLV